MGLSLVISHPRWLLFPTAFVAAIWSLALHPEPASVSSWVVPSPLRPTPATVAAQAQAAAAKTMAEANTADELFDAFMAQLDAKRNVFAEYCLIAVLVVLPTVLLVMVAAQSERGSKVTRLAWAILLVLDRRTWLFEAAGYYIAFALCAHGCSSAPISGTDEFEVALVGALLFPGCFAHSTVRHIGRSRGGRVGVMTASVVALGGALWACTLLPLALVRRNRLLGLCALLALHASLAGVAASLGCPPVASPARQAEERSSRKEAENEEDDEDGGDEADADAGSWLGVAAPAAASSAALTAICSAAGLALRRGSITAELLHPFVENACFVGHLGFLAWMLLLASRRAPGGDDRGTFAFRQLLMLMSLSVFALLGSLLEVVALWSSSIAFAVLWVLEKELEMQGVSLVLRLVGAAVLLRALSSRLDTVNITAMFEPQGLYA
eukprot:TRINITY_DN54370_c0_g1_i1.p1 TRINITY_DN54370_c0_g1~~TRINITY_DN54370_c0_g1_i1.p1  ORF type:complete len:453 (-),score=97.34 TRINITY_DN54370_c0_g1_i1:252-1568(-)